MTAPTVDDLPTDQQIFIARLDATRILSTTSGQRIIHALFSELGIRAALPGPFASKVTVNDQVLDVSAVLALWGRHDTDYPRAGTEEVQRFRHRLVTTALTLGDTHHVGDIVEDVLRTIGLTAYIPPTSKQVVVDLLDLGIDQFTVEARLTRTGHIDQLELIRTILGRVRSRLEQRLPLPTNDPAPAAQS